MLCSETCNLAQLGDVHRKQYETLQKSGAASSCFGRTSARSAGASNPVFTQNTVRLSIYQIYFWAHHHRHQSDVEGGLSLGWVVPDQNLQCNEFHQRTTDERENSSVGLSVGDAGVAAGFAGKAAERRERVRADRASSVKARGTKVTGGIQYKAVKTIR